MPKSKSPIARPNRSPVCGKKTADYVECFSKSPKIRKSKSPKKPQIKATVEEEKKDQRVVKAASKKSRSRSPALSKSPATKFGKMSLGQNKKEMKQT